ncbi:hypothetical protein B0O99DRAFT_693225 [Bisporella sp. PMI_857]|nr:hypothetical protein B0O99DRAFT_693225 [Bisporella sp. PMI_857]
MSLPYTSPEDLASTSKIESLSRMIQWEPFLVFVTVSTLLFMFVLATESAEPEHSKKSTGLEAAGIKQLEAFVQESTPGKSKGRGNEAQGGGITMDNGQIWRKGPGLNINWGAEAGERQTQLKELRGRLRQRLPYETCGTTDLSGCNYEERSWSAIDGIYLWDLNERGRTGTLDDFQKQVLLQESIMELKQ